MAVVDIDIGLGAGTFQATIVDPQGNPAGSASVIQVSDPWSVDCTWQVSGVIALFAGTWKIQVLLEGLGGGAPELQQSEFETMVAGQLTPYTKPVTFPANFFLTHLGTEDSLSFNVNAVLTARTSANAPLPVAALVDLGVIQIYRFQ